MFAKWLPVIGLRGRVVVLVSLAHDHNVVAATEGVGVHLDGVKVGVGVAALCLVGRTAVIIPNWKLLDTFRNRIKSFSFRS